MAAGCNVDIIEKIKVLVEVPSPVPVPLLVGGNDLEDGFGRGWFGISSS
jgi:hypothetical protein